MDYTTVGAVIRDVYLGPMSEIAGFKLFLLDEEFMNHGYNYWIAGHPKGAPSVVWGRVRISESLLQNIQRRFDPAAEFAHFLQAECEALAKEFRDAIPR